MHSLQRGWTPRRADGALLLVAVIWGSGFIATEYALRFELPPALILAVRFWIAALILLPFQWRKLRALSGRALLTGIGAGAILCAAFFAQTYGQAGTSVSNSAFLTATNVVMVPFIVWLLARKRPPLKIYVLAAGTLLGIGILTLRFDGGFATIGQGDWIVLISALLFAIHIAYLGTVALGLDAGLLTLLQMLTSALTSTVALLCLDITALRSIPWGVELLPVLYLALFSTCLCFFLQTAAQQWASAAKAAILLSTEGLFGSVFSVLLGLEPYSWRMGLGGAVIIMCVMLTEVDFTRLGKPRPLDP
ncbi:MAG: DMT family transporter [Clostridia bacterium]|nr:DMT family transporter [Clostridia bacterium]